MALSLHFGVMLLVLLAAPLLRAERTVRGVLLPTRRADATALREAVRSSAQTLAQQLGARLISDEASTQLRPTLMQAAEHDGKGELDRAAALFDRAIAEAKQAPHRVAAAEAADVVAAHIKRASIVLARNEPGAEAIRLLADLLGYDPSFALTGAEGSPPMRRAFDEARVLAIRDLGAERVGSACAEVTALLVGRPTAEGKLELVRFEGCRRVTAVVVEPGAPSVEGLLAPNEQRRATSAAPGRIAMVSAVAVGGVWLVSFVAAGGVLVADSAGAFDMLKTTVCGMAHTCDDSLVDGPRRNERIGWSLIGVGLGGAAAALSVGVALSLRNKAPAVRHAAVAF